jgi:cytidine deaminase
VSEDSRDRLADLLLAARAVRERAYAPYSGFTVGAAVLAGGSVFAGANVENASYPVSVCAERSAVSAMIAAGQRRIEAVALVAGGPDGPSSPCGACRQVLWEFADAGVPVVSEHADGGSRVRWTVGELLPAAFDLSR